MGGSGLLALNWALYLSSPDRVYLGLHSKAVRPDFARTISLESCSRDFLISTFNTLKIGTVINTIGLSDVDLCQAKPQLAIQVNALIPEQIASACFALNIPFLHVSSDQLFSTGSEAHTESSVPSPINIYGSTKVLAEKIILDANPRSVIIRTNFFGWGTSYRSSYSDYILKALNASKTLELSDHVTFSPLAATSVAKHGMKLLAKKANGIFNVSSVDSLTKYQFGCALAEVFGFDPALIKRQTYNTQDLRAPRPSNMSLNSQKLSEFLSCPLPDVRSELLLLKKEMFRGHQARLADL